MQPVSHSGRRVQELDALRGIACVLVTLAHFHVGSGLSDELGVFAQHAVELFFVISGFVICMTLERTPSLGEFAVARFARLYPAYAASVLLVAALHVMGSRYLGPPRPVSMYLENLMMWHPLLGVESVNVVYWTLWVELKFYLIVAVLAIPRFFRFVEPHAAGWLAAVVAYEAAQRWLFDGGKLPGVHFLYGLSIPEQCHYFVSGIALYRIWSSGWTVTRGALLTACLARELFMFNSHRTPAVLLVWCTFLALIAGKLLFLNRRPLLFLGKISYSVYLVHAVCGSLVIAMLGASVGPVAKFALALVVSLAFATALSLTVEYPALHLIRRTFKRKPPLIPRLEPRSSSAL